MPMSGLFQAPCELSVMHCSVQTAAVNCNDAILN